jgi:hypothetical protein
MKTIEIKLYAFQELSKEAQKKALEIYASNDYYHHGDDVVKTLKKGAEYFGAELKNYEIDFMDGTPSYAKFECSEEAPTAKELKALIIGMGTYNKKTLRGDGECKLTGVCFDEDFFDGVRKCYFKEKARQIDTLLRAGFQSLLRAAQADAEHQFSIEGYAEHCEANEYTFEEDGSMRND